LMERNSGQYNMVSTVQTLLYFPYNLDNVHEGVTPSCSVTRPSTGCSRPRQAQTLKVKRVRSTM
jgi:hypothetical protein